MKHTHKFLTAFTILVLLLSALPVQTAQAAFPLIVNTAVDENDGECTSDCSLRDAIALSGIGNGNTIQFNSGLSGNTITLSSTLTIGKDLTIDGSSLASHITINGNGNRVFYVNNGYTVTFTSLDITGGVAGSANGGGIYNDGSTVTVNDVNFTSNSASGGYGGAIHNETTTSSPTLNVNNSTFANNTASSGGAIYGIGTMSIDESEFTNNSVNGWGGAIHFNGTVTISNSTFSGNNTSAFSGGAIFHYGGNLALSNSTLYNNSADDYGGGIYVNTSAVLTASNSTLSGNTATNNDGNSIYSYGGILHLKNSILADSASGYDCYNDGGTVPTNTHTIIEDNAPGVNACGTPASSADPKLGTLADNGGSTRTMNLLTGSPAVNAGDNATCEATDQRGVTRPQGAACDIGAVEVEYLVVTTADDSGAGSLRQTIADANAGDFIMFDASLSGNTITLASVLTIDKDLTIDGAGLDSNINISGGDTVQVFSVSGGSTVVMNRLNVIDGSASIGSGIYNNGDTTISNSTISDNFASASGGGIYNSGTVTVINSTFSNNSATNFGGGIFHTGSLLLTVSHSTFSGNGNSATQKGGGIFTYGTAMVVNSTFSANEAIYGGGLFNSGTATILNNTFYGNIASIHGNGLYNDTDEILHLKNTILYHDHSVDPKQDCYNVSGNVIDTDVNNILYPMGPLDNRCGTLGSAADPLLGTLNDNGGPTQTHALQLGSPAIDAGDNATCADADTVNNLDQRGATRPYGPQCDIGAYELLTGKQIFKSQKTYDGWILESSETSGKGGTKNNTSKTFFVGDDASNRQYRSILSFNTSGIPDDAVITKVILKVKKAGLVGTNPLKTHGGLYADIRKNKFGTSKKLQLSDFKASANQNKAGRFKKASSGWYKAVLGSGAYPYIKLNGTTQFRLRFAKDDNNDFGTDYMKFYSGNAGTSSRPQLIVEYYVP